MKALQFNANSWHYKLSQFPSTYRNTDDICSYTKSVLAGFLLFTIVFAVAFLLAWSVVDLIIWIIVGLQVGTFPELLGGSVALILLLVAVMLFLIVLAYGAISYTAHRIKNVNQGDNFVVNAYQSAKYKFCVPVEIKHGQ